MHGVIGLSGNARLASLVRDLESRGEPFALATVVSRRPPVSAQLGDKAVIRADGTIVGWIGGSCSQPVVRREALAAITAGRPRLVRLTTAELEGVPALEGVSNVAMTCPSGGEAEIYIEPHLRRPNLVAVGETPLVRALAQMAPVVGFGVTVVTERALMTLEDDGVRYVGLADFGSDTLGMGSFVVVASAGHYDEEALARALAAPVPYVALVASRKRAGVVLQFLREHGVGEPSLARIRTPAGLDIKAATQEEIALSILAEIVREYRAGLAAGVEAGEVAVAVMATAVDPVCGMEVEVAAARHQFEYAGVTYYFCCPHCRAKFVKDPAQYLTGGSG